MNSEIRAPQETHPWVHFAAVVILLFTVQLTGRLLLADPPLGPALLFRSTLASMYTFFPIAGAVAAGATIGRSARSLLWITVATFALMAVADLAATPPPETATTAVGSSGAFEGAAGGDRDIESVSLIRSIGNAIGGNMDAATEVQTGYMPGNPRLLASQLMTKFGVLLGTLAAIGVTLGIRSWIDDRVIFKSDRDELVAALLVTWIVSPLVVLGPLHWSFRARFGVLFRGDAELALLMPYVPVLLLAALGWRRSRR